MPDLSEEERKFGMRLAEGTMQQLTNYHGPILMRFSVQAMFVSIFGADLVNGIPSEMVLKAFDRRISEMRDGLKQMAEGKLKSGELVKQ